MIAMNKKYYFVGIISLIILLADQISKHLINANIDFNQSFEIVNNFFYLTYYHNSGAAFNILNNMTFFIIIISVFILVFLLIEMKKYIDSKIMRVSFGFLFGGLLGNLIDRIALGYVRDFFDFRIFGYEAPIFNISDIFIVSGTILLVISLIMEEKNARNNSKN